MTEKLRDKARALGLERLTDEHLKQFERATTGMERPYAHYILMQGASSGH